MPQPHALEVGSKQNLPSPVQVDRLAIYLRGYNTTEKSFLLDGFTSGFCLGSSYQIKARLTCKNHRSAVENPAIVERKILKELEKGRYVGPFNSPPFDNFVCSPIGLVEKSTPGSYRLIHDLSYPRGDDSINSTIPKHLTSVSYQNIETVISLVKKHGRHCLMAKADIEDAFRLICVSPSDYHLLGFFWDDSYFYDRSLAMGCSSACQIFERFSSSLQWILNKQFALHNVSHLLDDFFFVGRANTEQCRVALDTFFRVCADIKVPIKSEKTHFPSTVIVIYGIEIDSNEMIARLPKDKLERICRDLARFKQKRSVTLSELQSLLGLLNFACSVIIPGRTFLRRLYDLTIGHTKPSYRITLNADARADLKAWYEFIYRFNGKSCFLFNDWLSSDAIKFYSDAAGVHGGFAAVFGSSWLVGSWPNSMKPFSITFKELFPIVLALEIWGHKVKNHKILFLTDNAAVADIINKSTCKDKSTMILVRRLVLAALKCNVFVRSKHIPGKTNVICDLLSRFSLQEAHSLAPWLDKEPTPVPARLLSV